MSTEAFYYGFYSKLASYGFSDDEMNYLTDLVSRSLAPAPGKVASEGALLYFDNEEFVKEAARGAAGLIRRAIRGVRGGRIGRSSLSTRKAPAPPAASAGWGGARKSDAFAGSPRYTPSVSLPPEGSSRAKLFDSIRNRAGQTGGAVKRVGPAASLPQRPVGSHEVTTLRDLLSSGGGAAPGMAGMGEGISEWFSKHPMMAQALLAGGAGLTGGYLGSRGSNQQQPQHHQLPPWMMDMYQQGGY